MYAMSGSERSPSDLARALADLYKALVVRRSAFLTGHLRGLGAFDEEVKNKAHLDPDKVKNGALLDEVKVQDWGMSMSSWVAGANNCLGQSCFNFR